MRRRFQRFLIIFSRIRLGKSDKKSLSGQFFNKGCLKIFQFYPRFMNLIRYIVGVLFLVITILTIAQVFFRFALNSPLIWSEELARFMLIWMVMLGGAVLTFQDTHLAIPELAQTFPLKIRYLIDLLFRIAVVVMLLIMVWTSPKLLKASWHISSGALQIPFSFWRAAAPVGAFLMACSTLYHIPGILRRLLGSGREA